MLGLVLLDVFGLLVDLLRSEGFRFSARSSSGTPLWFWHRVDNVFVHSALAV